MGIRDELSSSTESQEVTGEDALTLLVGEGKKYATPAELAKATLNGQNHIQTLEQENATLRDSATKAKGVDDILAQLKGQHNTDGNPGETDQSATQDSVSPADLVAKAFAERDEKAAQAQADTNVKSVAAELQKRLGDKATEQYDKVAAECGVDLDELAARSPEAVIRLVAGAQTPAQQSGHLPASTQQGGHQQLDGGIVGKAAIQKLYDSGKIKRHEKIALENKQLTALGGDKFWAN